MSQLFQAHSFSHFAHSFMCLLQWCCTDLCWMLQSPKIFKQWAKERERERTRQTEEERKWEIYHALGYLPWQDAQSFFPFVSLSSAGSSCRPVISCTVFFGDLCKRRDRTGCSQGPTAGGEPAWQVVPHHPTTSCLTITTVCIIVPKQATTSKDLWADRFYTYQSLTSECLYLKGERGGGRGWLFHNTADTQRCMQTDLTSATALKIYSHTKQFAATLHNSRLSAAGATIKGNWDTVTPLSHRSLCVRNTCGHVFGLYFYEWTNRLHTSRVFHTTSM